MMKSFSFPPTHPAHLLDEILRGDCRRDLVRVQVTAYERSPAEPTSKEVASAAVAVVEDGAPKEGFSGPMDHENYGSNRVANEALASQRWLESALRFGRRARADYPRSEWGIKTVLGEHYFWPAADLCLVDGITPGWKILDTKTSLAALYESLSGQVAEFSIYRTGHSFHAYANRLLPVRFLEQWLEGLGGMPAVDQKWCKIQMDAGLGLTLRWSDSLKSGCIVPEKLDVP